MKKAFSKTGLILIYPGYQNEAKQYQYGRMIEEFSKFGIKIDKMKVDEIIFGIQKNHSNLKISQYDFCIQFVTDKYINALLEKEDIRSFNSYSATKNCDDKMLASTILADNDIQMPATISGFINIGVEQIDTISSSQKLKDYVEKSLDYPLIVKKSNSKGGRDIYKIHNRTELEAICKKLDGSHYLFQKFIPDNPGKDIRVPVIGGKVVGSFMRSNTNDFRSNIKLGGQTTPYEISENHIEMAEKVAKILKLDYCSVDFFVTNDKKPLVCEVNADPALQSMEQILGKNIAEIYAKYIMKEIYH